MEWSASSAMQHAVLLSEVGRDADVGSWSGLKTGLPFTRWRAVEVRSDGNPPPATGDRSEFRAVRQHLGRHGPNFLGHAGDCALGQIVRDDAFR